MFAFCYYDEEKKWFVQGSIRIKPLYYTQNNDFPLMFSSELKI